MRINTPAAAVKITPDLHPDIYSALLPSQMLLAAYGGDIIREIISMVIMSLKLDFQSESRAGEKYIHWEFVRSSWDPLKSAHVCWVLSEPPLSVLRNTWRSSFHLANITLKGEVFMGWQKSKYLTLNIIISLSLFNSLISQVCHEEYTWRSSIHVPTFLV